MVKLPSVFSLWKQFRNVLFRFPLQALISVIAMVLWIWTNDNHNIQNSDQLYKAIILCNLAFTLSLSANLYAENNKWKPAKSFILQMLALAICVILFSILSPALFKTDLLRLVLFLFAGHLLISFSMYYHPTKIFEFWHFNKALFLRFVTAVLFSFILFAGLSIALLSIDALFNYQLSGDTYFNLFIIIAVGFNTLFFLAGIPENINDSKNINDQQNSNYPKVLKIFTQYVLIPLLTIYFGILVVYEIKIAINSQLPDGMVSLLILGYAVFGILSYLLIYPISKESGNEWMRQFAKLFFWLMLPLLILLFVAIWVRVTNYGLTEMRYFIILLAIWLLGITLYFIINKHPRIQFIPISLCICTFLSTYGPQSAATLAKKSQQARLQKYISHSKKEAIDEKISIINYLVGFHGLTALQEFTSKNLTPIQNKIIWNTDSLKNNSYLIRSNLKDTAFNLLAIDANSYHLTHQFINFDNQEKIVAIAGFDYAYWLQYGMNDEIDSPLGKIEINYRHKNFQGVSIKIGKVDSVKFNISLFEKDLLEKYKLQELETSNSGISKDDNIILPASWMKLSKTSSDYKVEINIQRITSNNSKDLDISRSSTFFTGYLLISKK